MENEWVVFGNQGEYRAHASGRIQTRVRRGKRPDGKPGKKIVDEWLDLEPRKGRTDMSGGYYYSVNAGLNGKTSGRVHTIICNLFHGARPNGRYEVDHKKPPSLLKRAVSLVVSEVEIPLFHRLSKFRGSNVLANGFLVIFKKSTTF